MVEIPAGESVTITASLSGMVEPGAYELIWRPQPLPTPDEIDIVASRNGGGTVLSHDEPILRRTLLTGDSSDAWRPDDHPVR